MSHTIVRFMSLAGAFKTVREARFATTAGALVAVTEHAKSGGFTNVQIVDEGDGDGVRFTATSPGGRKGRNVAFGDFDWREPSTPEVACMCGAINPPRPIGDDGLERCTFCGCH